MRLDLIWQIARKELLLFFASPIAYLVLGTFLAITLFVFFWGSAFFARNIADVRPLFEWLPIVLIFLASAVSMRMWSEERRSGTLEYVLTLPVSTTEFVLGKALACWLLIALALAFTLPLPFSISLIAEIDWGPIYAGYLAALLLAFAYLAIGLFVSASTDSQIVSLLVAVALCGSFYMIGAPALTDYYPAAVQNLLGALGSGARFESITRGLIDLRDLYFYTSVAALFLTLNVYSLQRQQWAKRGDSQRHFRVRLGVGLLLANIALPNVWLYPTTALRADMTAGQIYSISQASRGYLQQLREPLLIRGYFSAKTHPLLAPLVPQMQDLLREYEIAGNGAVRVEIVDPAQDPEQESEANSKYGIRAVPFQVADRYQASVVNSYFDVLVEYGDEYEVLSFADLIEVKAGTETELDVRLKNPEFDVTRSIKRVLYGFQNGASIFANINDDVRLVAYLSADAVLPEALVEFKTAVRAVASELSALAPGKFALEVVQPEADGGAVAAQIGEEYGFRPMVANLFDNQSFYFYLTLQAADTVVQLPLPEAFDAESLRRSIDEGLKRFATGVLKTVVVTLPNNGMPPPRGMPGPQVNQFTQLEQMLSTDVDVVRDDLTTGVVPQGTELVMVLEPTDLSETQVFALDQFLMRGGTVVVATAPYRATISRDTLLANPHTSGLDEWLAHHGVTIAQSMVMDPQNTAFPLPVTRQAGGFSFQELMLFNYPYFMDLRGDGLSQTSPITRGLPQVTLSWAAPITANPDTGVTVTPLLRSSDDSWLSSNTDILPRLSDDGRQPFVVEGEQSSHMVAALLQGRFSSYYQGKDSPPLNSQNPLEESEDQEPPTLKVESVIERAPESARLLVFASNDFVADQTLGLVGSAQGVENRNGVQLLMNAVDWSLEDQNLTSISARGAFNRTLPPLAPEQQRVIEVVNYAFAVVLIAALVVGYRLNTRRRRVRYQRWLDASADKAVAVGGQS